MSHWSVWQRRCVMNSLTDRVVAFRLRFRGRDWDRDDGGTVCPAGMGEEVGGPESRDGIGPAWKNLLMSGTLVVGSLRQVARTEASLLEEEYCCEREEG